MAVVRQGGETSLTSAPLAVKLGAALIYDAPGVMTFNGTAGDVLQLPHDPDYQVTAGTIAFSFNPADTSGAQGLFAKDATNNGNGGHVAIYLQGSTLTARFQSSSTEAILSFSGVAAGTEYEVAATFLPVHESG